MQSRKKKKEKKRRKEKKLERHRLVSQLTGLLGKKRKKGKKL